MAYRGVLFRGFRLFGDNLVSCAGGGGGGGGLSGLDMAGGLVSLVDVNLNEDSPLLREVFGEGRRRAQLSYGIKQVDSSDVDPLVSFRASETLRHKLDFLSIASWVGLA